MNSFEQMVQDWNDDKRQRFAGLLRTCAGIAEELAGVHSVEEKTVCRLPCDSEPLPLIRSIWQHDFLLCKLPHRPIRSQNDVPAEYVSQCRC